MNYERFYSENAAGTKVLCAIADHSVGMLSLEQDFNISNIVNWTRTNLCQNLLDAGYIQVWRDLDSYIEQYFAATEEFGVLCTEFVPQSDWDALHTSTKQNCSYVWADSVEELETLWLEKTIL